MDNYELIITDQIYRHIRGEAIRTLIIKHELANLPEQTSIAERARLAKKIGEALKPLMKHHLIAVYETLPIQEPITITSPIDDVFSKAKEMHYEVA